MNDEIDNYEEPSTSSELANMGRKTVGVVQNVGNLALGMGKKLNNDKKNEDGKEENKEVLPKKDSLDDSDEVKNIGKKSLEAGGKIAKEGAKKVGQGIKKLWMLIPAPWNFIILGVAILIILVLILIMMLGGSESGGDCGSKSYSCTEIKVMYNGVEVTVPLEEYVAGVVSREAYTEFGIEALKAQAVVARTYAIVSTNDCTKTIGSSTYAQVYSPTTDEKAITAAEETSGQVLTYEGKMFLTQYDSFCYADSNCPDAIKNSDGTYTVTYTKQPDLTTHKITLNKLSSFILPGQGHGFGMSQLVSYELADQGYDYKEILEYFYSDGIEITSGDNDEECSIGESDALEYASQLDFEGDYWNYWFNNTTRLEGKSLNSALGSDGIAEINSYIKAQKDGVEDSGEKVASVGMGLALYLFNEGYRLPYYWGGGHAYISTGVDTSWGSSASQMCSPGRCYSYNGLDCSGFVMWALQNAGCSNATTIVSPNFTSFISRTAKRSSISEMKPGDLLMSTGHVILVIGYREDLDRIITVESAGGTNGLVVRAYSESNISSGSYYKLNMDSYYNNYCS